MYQHFYRHFRRIVSTKFRYYQNYFYSQKIDSKNYSLKLPTYSFQNFWFTSISTLPIIFAYRLTTIKCFTAAKSSENNVEIEKLIQNAKDAIKNESFDLAKKNLNDALNKSEQYQIFTHVPLIFDYLAVIAINDGTVLEVEELLIRFIEKLILIGFKENDDNIIRYKLKLSKLYHVVGNTEMAELGFRDCINILEEKLHKNKDESNSEHYAITSLVYISSLFWYGRFLTEEEELDKAKIYLKKALHFSRKQIKYLTPSQLMVILFHNAEIEFKLKEYDNSIAYLVEAINICMDTNTVNDELPIFVVKLGIVYLYKGIYDKAKFWCESAGNIADMYNSPSAKAESILCLESLSELNKRK